jgi:phage gp36-like protein
MSWITPTRSNLLASVSKDELEKAASLGIEMDQDIVAEIISRTVNFVRGYIRKGGYEMGDSGKLPQELLAPAMDYAAFDLFKRIGGKLSDERKAARNDALQIFKSVAKSEVGLEDPAGSDAASTAASAPSMSSATRNYGRDNEDGI